MGAIKGIPYGMSNFTDVREQNCYYVDKTMYLPLLEEQAHYLIFVRPLRFGKSLFGAAPTVLEMPFAGRGEVCSPDNTPNGLHLPRHIGTFFQTLRRGLESS